jgi:hypothetical protein
MLNPLIGSEIIPNLIAMFVALLNLLLLI